MNFIIIPIIILIGVVIIISIIPNKKKIKINSDKLGLLANEGKEVLEEVKNLKIEIEDICSFVEKHYDKSKNLIAIEPKDYGFYDEIIDPIEKTEVMVIEYLQNLKAKQRNYKFVWDYQGLIEGLCVYKITKTLKYTKKQNFSIEDITSALLKNDTISGKPFTDKILNILVIPFLVPIDNLGFNRELNEVEMRERMSKLLGNQSEATRQRLFILARAGDESATKLLEFANNFERAQTSISLFGFTAKGLAED